MSASVVYELKKRLVNYPGPLPGEEWKRDRNLNHCKPKTIAEMHRLGTNVEELMAAGLDRGQVHHMLFGYRYERRLPERQVEPPKPKEQDDVMPQCPLRVLGLQLYMSTGHDLSTSQIVKSKACIHTCAWYDHERKCCAFLTMSRKERD